MAKLIALTPGAGLLPVSAGSVTLSEISADRLTSVAPFKGQDKAVGAALKKAGLGWPKPGQSVTGKGGEVVWFGMGKALSIDADLPDLSGLAAVTDQTDGWALVQIDGAGALDVLARLVPVDLRALGTGGTVRSLIGHMTASITRTGDQTFRLMVMRSMTQTLVHEVHEAMEHLAARG